MADDSQSSDSPALAPSRSAPSGPRRGPPPELPPDTVVGGYILDERLGSGGFGTVYRAHSGPRPFALKLLSLESSQGWEEREVDVLRRLDHPNVVKLRGYLDWPEADPRYRVLVMEFVDGLTLDEWVRHHNPSALGVVELMLPLLEALEAVHQAGVVHRDIKETNIRVRRADRQPVLVDFGAGAYEGAPSLTSSALPPGTREYRSPEAWEHFRRYLGEQAGPDYEATAADDLWALGVVLYWMLTDRKPFVGENVLEVGRAVLTTTPLPPRERNRRVPRALERVCLRMLEKAPGSRYASARELHAVLSELKLRADSSWREPLFESHGAHSATTLPVRGRAESQDLLSRLMRMMGLPPRRGPAWRKDGPPVALSDSVFPSGPVPRGGVRSWRWLTWSAGLAALLSVPAVVATLRPHASSEEPRPFLEVPFSPQPEKSSSLHPISWEGFFQEVSPPWKPPDSEGDEAPPIPAPVINSKQGETPMHAMKNTTKAPEAREVKKTNARTGTLGAARKLAMAAATTAALCTGAGCASTPARPKGLYKSGMMYSNCHSSQVESMKKLGIKIGEERKATLLMHRMEPTQPWEQTPYDESLGVPDRVGEVAPIQFRLLEKPWGKLIAHESWLQGKMYIAPDRVYAVIQSVYVQDPRKDPTHHNKHEVCMEVYAVDGTFGMPKVPPDFRGDPIQTHSTVIVKAVDAYE